MAVLTVLDLIMLVIMLQKYYSGSPYGNSVTFLQVTDFLFCAIFVLEFIVEILGIGLIQYFYSTLKLVEFACSCLVRPLQLSMIVESSNRPPNLFEADPIIMYVKTLLLMRAARIYVFFVAIIPKLLDLIDKKMDEDLFDLYDVGKAYLIAQEQVMKLLEHLVTNTEVYTEIMKILEADRQIVSNILGLVKCDRTTIATTNKTNHAIRHVVNTMNDLITKMKDDDLLDTHAARSLFAELEEVKAKVRSVNVVKPLEPHLLLAEIPWLKNESATVEFLLKHGRRSSYSKGELIISQGDSNFGLLILIEGLVRTTYIPSVSALELNSKYGALPNYDFFNNLKFDVPQEDYVTSSSVIGEIGVATNREYNMRALCLTSVELMWIPGRILNAIINQSRDSVVYQCSLWKAIAVKISLNVLQDIPYFRGWTREKLLLYLQSGVVPVLKGVTVVTLNEHVNDVILVEGIAMDYKTSMTFVGPYYIPRIVGSLLLPGSPLMDRTTNIETRLFVIPNVESDAEDLSGPEGLFKDFLKKTEKEVDEIGSKGRTVKEFPIDCKKNNRKDHMSAHEKKRMKKLKRLLKAVKFVDHIPTVKGAIEGLPSSASFVYQQENKELTVAAHPKRKYYDTTYNYIGDVEETSESRGIKYMYSILYRILIKIFRQPYGTVRAVGERMVMLRKSCRHCEVVCIDPSGQQLLGSTPRSASTPPPPRLSFLSTLRTSPLRSKICNFVKGYSANTCSRTPQCTRSSPLRPPVLISQFSHLRSYNTLITHFGGDWKHIRDVEMIITAQKEMEKTRASDTVVSNALTMQQKRKPSYIKKSEGDIFLVMEGADKNSESQVSPDVRMLGLQ
ncbi:unnamed protein product, partial [Nesidiocoris tenuis]